MTKFASTAKLNPIPIFSLRVLFESLMAVF